MDGILGFIKVSVGLMRIILFVFISGCKVLLDLLCGCWVFLFSGEGLLFGGFGRLFSFGVVFFILLEWIVVLEEVGVLVGCFYFVLLDH